MPALFRAVYDDCRQWWPGKHVNGAALVKETENLENKLWLVFMCQERRTLFKTCGNCVEWGPSDIQPGGIICVLYSAALVLRFQQGDFLDTLVGDARAWIEESSDDTRLRFGGGWRVICYVDSDQ